MFSDVLAALRRASRVEAVAVGTAGPLRPGPRPQGARRRAADGRRAASARALRRAGGARAGAGELAVELTALAALPEIRPGDDLGRLLADAAPADMRDGDVLAVAHKAVSKAEGRVR